MKVYILQGEIVRLPNILFPLAKYKYAQCVFVPLLYSTVQVYMNFVRLARQNIISSLTKFLDNHWYFLIPIKAQYDYPFLSGIFVKLGKGHYYS